MASFGLAATASCASSPPPVPCRDRRQGERHPRGRGAPVRMGRSGAWL